MRFIRDIFNLIISLVFAFLAAIGYIVVRKLNLLQIIEERIASKRKIWFFKVKPYSAKLVFEFKFYIYWYYDEEDGRSIESVNITLFGNKFEVRMPDMLRNQVWRYIEVCSFCGERHL